MTGRMGLAVGLALAALSVSGFAATFIFGESLTRTHGVSPEVLSFLRFAIAGSVMLAACSATARGRRQLFAPTRREWLAMLVLAPIGTCLMAWFVFMGCARVSTANASMADALTPLMIFAVDAIRKRRVAAKGLVGLVFGFLGALLVIQVIHTGGIALEAYTIGDVYIMLSAAVWGVYTVWGRNLIFRFGSSVFTVWTMLIGAVMIGALLPFGAFVWPKTATAWLQVAGLGLVSTLLPFWTWNAAGRFLPISTLAMMAYFTPVVAVALGIAFLGDRVSALQWLGMAFIVGSALIEKVQEW